MPRYAVIENDEVVNVIVADAKFIKEQKITGVECGDEVYPGWKYAGKEFIAPAPGESKKIVNETIPE